MVISFPTRSRLICCARHHQFPLCAQPGGTSFKESIVKKTVIQLELDDLQIAQLRNAIDILPLNRYISLVVAVLKALPPASASAPPSRMAS